VTTSNPNGSPPVPPQDDDVFPPTEQNSLFSVITVGGSPKSRRLKSSKPPKIPDELLMGKGAATPATPSVKTPEPATPVTVKDAVPHAGLVVEPVPPEPVAGETKTVGDTLKRARILKGWSIQDVSGFIKIAPRQIDALERNDFSSLPMRTFVRGFVRNYSRLLGLDPAEMIALLPQNIAITTEDDAELHTLVERRSAVAARDNRPSTQKRGNMLIWILVCVILVFLIAFVALHPAVQQWARVKFAPPASSATVAAQSQTTTPEASPTLINEQVVPILPIQPREPGGVTGAMLTDGMLPPEAQVAPEAPAPVVVSYNQTAELVIQVQGGESWVEVHDGNDAPLVMVLAQPGYKRTVKGLPPFSVVLGKSEFVQLTFQGAVVDPSTFNRRRDGVTVATIPAATR
jgi:cytoskeleton protein RodZ